MTTIAYVAIGTNIGNKLENIELALEEIKTKAGDVRKTSRLYRTRPQYVQDQPHFFNIVTEISTYLDAETLLCTLKSIERYLGRISTYRYGPRVIDLDIILYGNTSFAIETAEGPLRVPHERLAERDFVLAPLCDIAPEYRHPVLQESMQVLYDRLWSNKDSCTDWVESLLPVKRDAPWTLGAKTYVMGILNVTPDSFSDGNDYVNHELAVKKAGEMEQAGVDIIDIGGESTRPGAAAVSVEEELSRVLPVIQKIRERSNIPISIDTTKARVAMEAVREGANVVNDVSAGLKDEKMLSIVASLRVPLVLMHMRGTPLTMANSSMKKYQDIVKDVSQALMNRVQAAQTAGIYSWNIIIDPGIGFAKDKDLNLQLLRDLALVKSSCRDLPLMVGPSRKGFIGLICQRADPKARGWGSAAACCAAVAGKADILRVHDAEEMIDVSRMADALWRPGWTFPSE